MDSDNDSYNSESEFYYPDEQNVLQENKNKLKMAAKFKNCLQSTLWKKKNCLGPYSRPLAYFFPIRTSRPANNIYIFFMITMFVVFPTFVA